MLRSRSLSSDDAAIACSVRSNSSEGDGTRRGASRCLWSWVTATVYPEVYPSDMPPLLARRGASRCLWSWEAERRQAEAQKHNSITYTRTRFFFLQAPRGQAALEGKNTCSVILFSFGGFDGGCVGHQHIHIYTYLFPLDGCTDGCLSWVFIFIFFYILFFYIFFGWCSTDGCLFWAFDRNLFFEAHTRRQRGCQHGSVAI